MKLKKSFEITDEIENKIISVAYGDASLRDKIRVSRLASRNDVVRNILDNYKRTAREVKSIGEEEMPHEILKSIQIKNLSAINKTSSFFYDLFSIIMARPVVSAAVSVILITAMATSLIINKPVQYNYTDEEIAAADRQAKYALSIVGNIFRETSATLQNEVLVKAVAKPFRQSIEIANNLLEGEKK
ncbi:MAG: hypothetical protein CVV24_00240 [Ignavibacteriae bacterium HGW-Ignavibacteriae-3]|nr:MAG: hypothetical protein CVV24_00240 [Ignavibacteriae bacterium HGW-Ignavibacteriae-3]